MRRQGRMRDQKNMEMVYMISLKMLNTTTKILSSLQQRALVVMTNRAAGKSITLRAWAACIPAIRIFTKKLKFRSNYKVFMCLYPSLLLSRLKLSTMTSSVRSCYNSSRASASQLRAMIRMESRCP